MKTPDAFIELLSQQLNDLMTQGKQTGQDMRTNIQALVQSQLAKLDVVSREEFEAQQRILIKTRQQLDQLSTQIKELEDRLGSK